MSRIDYFDGLVEKYLIDFAANDPAEVLPALRKIVHSLDQNFIARYDRLSAQSLADIDRTRTPLVVEVDEGDPVNRVREYLLHQYFFGAP